MVMFTGGVAVVVVVVVAAAAAVVVVVVVVVVVAAVAVVIVVATGTATEENDESGLSACCPFSLAYFLPFFQVCFCMSICLSSIPLATVIATLEVCNSGKKNRNAGTLKF